MKKTKTKSIHARVDEDSFERISSIAGRYGLECGTLSRILLKEFCNAAEEKGNQLIWPPQFNYHISNETQLSRIGQADGERLDLVADPSGGTYNKPPPGQRFTDLEKDLDEKIDGEPGAKDQRKRPTG